MATTDSSSWMMGRLVAWRTWSLAGAVLVSTLILNMLVLGAAPALEIGSDAPPPTSSPASTAPPSTVLLGIGTPNGPRPIPTVVSSEPPEDLTSVADGATPAEVQNVVAQPTPAGPTPVVVPVTTAEPPPAPTTQPPTTQAPIAKAPTTQPPTTAAPTTQPPTTQPPTTQPPTTAAPTTEAPAVQYLTYTATSGAGDIVIAFTGSEISLYGFYPTANWVSRTEQNGPRTVKLEFFNTATEREGEWKAQIEGGHIQVEN